MIDHDDETGKPCTRHPAARDALLAWAAVGSRISGYHHDSASKLQSMMMALDEAGELVGDNPEASRALETAMTSLRELHALLTDNRALAKAPQRKPVALAELLTRASGRYGTKLVGDPGAATVVVATQAAVQALALLFDLCAGALQSTRTVTVSVQSAEDHVIVQLGGTPPEGAGGEAIAVATFLIARDGGKLQCSPRGFVVQLPTRARSSAESP